jgi:hypothetical protein
LGFDEDIHFELIFGFTLVKRGLTMQKLINHDTEGPNISFRTVDVFDKSLWRHVNGRADVDIFEFGSE